MKANPSAVVVGLLDQQVFGETRWELGNNLYRGYPRVADDAVPHVACFVLLRAGEAMKYLVNDLGQLSSLVTVYVRGEPQHFADGEDLARATWLYLHSVTVPTDYQDCQVMESEPEFWGLDDVGHPVWTLNLRLLREE